MNYLNQAVSAINSGIDAVVNYIAENGTVMAILLAAAFFIRSQRKKEFFQQSDMSHNETTTLSQVHVLSFHPSFGSFCHFVMM